MKYLTIPIVGEVVEQRVVSLHYWWECKLDNPFEEQMGTMLSEASVLQRSISTACCTPETDSCTRRGVRKCLLQHYSEEWKIRTIYVPISTIEKQSCINITENHSSVNRNEVEVLLTCTSPKITLSFKASCQRMLTVWCYLFVQNLKTYEIIRFIV